MVFLHVIFIFRLRKGVGNYKVDGASSLENLECILEAHLSDVEDRRAASFIVITEAIGFDGIGLSTRVSLMLTHYLEFGRGLLGGIGIVILV
ncbi:MAG: hypothetical protein O2783_07615 [Chloroflexi bacterium]|nr:hypothetical protein [Chloroflexota bacterium]